MDIHILPSSERGLTRLPWLISRHSFSFGHYYEPRRMGWGSLRVINDDWVAPSAGFPPHGHANMEIVSIVLAGALAHRDSIGNVEMLRAGEVQRMSAGTGIEHSEFNPSSTEPVRFLQVWIHPAHTDTPPSYEQRLFSQEDRLGRWQLLVSPNGNENSLVIDQDAKIFATSLPAGTALAREIPEGRRAWIQLTRGIVQIEGQTLHAGDAAVIPHAGRLTLQACEDADIYLFEVI